MWTRSLSSAILAATTASNLAHAAAIARATTSQQNCASNSFNENGNWFCKAVGQITYSNFAGASGQYDEVTGMDATTGQCSFGKKSYSGPLAPFNEPVSLHFRGPIRLKQVAVYMPKGSSKREESETTVEEVPQVAAWQEENEKRDHPIIWVTATINGQAVSWINDYWGPEATAASNPAQATKSVPAKAPAVPTAAASSSSPAATSGSSGKTDSLAVGGDYTRVAYYNAEQQTSQGLTFLANYGGQGSGKWTSTFGNTLSYVNAQGTDGASQSNILADSVVPSGHEFSIFTDEPCDGSCGFVQPGSVAYKGFGGADKTFLFEFSMPHEAGAAGAQADMPALWMLNARIPYTSQYSSCSCWQSGCGEFDIFEVLAPGDDKCKSTLHSVYKGGDSNYFARPVDSTIKVAVVFDSASGSVSAKVLDNATQFGPGLTTSAVTGLRQESGLGGMGSSLFQLG